MSGFARVPVAQLLIATAIAFAAAFSGGAASAQDDSGAIVREDRITDSVAAIPDWRRPMRSRDSALAEYASVFDCTGQILHQSFKGALESPLRFWFGVRDDDRIGGMVTKVGTPLDLPQQEITGRLSPHYDHDGRFTGGRLLVNWPYANAGQPVELAMMRETFIRSGPRINGVGKILHRTTKHTYLAGSLSFDPASHASLSSFYRVSFIAATCYPAHDLPELTSAE